MIDNPRAAVRAIRDRAKTSIREDVADVLEWLVDRMSASAPSVTHIPITGEVRDGTVTVPSVDSGLVITHTVNGKDCPGCSLCKPVMYVSQTAPTVTHWDIPVLPEAEKPKTRGEEKARIIVQWSDFRGCFSVAPIGDDELSVEFTKPAAAMLQRRLAHEFDAAHAERDREWGEATGVGRLAWAPDGGWTPAAAVGYAQEAAVSGRDAAWSLSLALPPNVTWTPERARDYSLEHDKEIRHANNLAWCKALGIAEMGPEEGGKEVTRITEKVDGDAVARGYRMGIQAEREACADLARTATDDAGYAWAAGPHIAKAIRARSTPTTSNNPADRT